MLRTARSLKRLLLLQIDGMREKSIVGTMYKYIDGNIHTVGTHSLVHTDKLTERIRGY